MHIEKIPSSLVMPLSQFLSDPDQVLQQGGTQAVTVFHHNRPYFHVLTPEGWMQHFTPQPAGIEARNPIQSPSAPDHPASAEDDFAHLRDILIRNEMQRVQSGEYSHAALGNLRNRLDAHVMPFFQDHAPSATDTALLENFVSRLQTAGLEASTISQYLVLVRKLLKLAVRYRLLPDIPEMPKVRVVNRPRNRLTLQEYSAIVKTAHRLTRELQQAPQCKLEGRTRKRFWIAPRHLTLAPDMAWVIRFMVNSFVRPGDLRQLRHKHVQICRGKNLYLRLSLPETKRHDAPMVTMRPAVHVYEAALAHAQTQGRGGPDDYVFMPDEPDRENALAILGFWFKWVMREAGVATQDTWGRPRTLYCLRHTAIMYRLLYGHGIDMLTLARNSRTSVQMIERFYASSLDGEMNVDLLQSRRGRT